MQLVLATYGVELVAYGVTHRFVTAINLNLWPLQSHLMLAESQLMPHPTFKKATHYPSL